MSTRAGIIIKDDEHELYFYRHSDGYPKGTMPTLEMFVDMIKQGKIRDDLMQCSGWLVLLGANEYEQTIDSCLEGKDKYYGWKVGAYEPMPYHPSEQGDIVYIYTIDLKTKTIAVMET